MSFPAFCPTCACWRTFNPDRCVVCGTPAPTVAAAPANVVAFRHHQLNDQARARSAGRRR